jgi:alkanesulfonate monooxygenase SsuD/methylene tetrahydromethanopterin reductase-like flavin-dependent oxidoreductase (luciferase family)
VTELGVVFTPQFPPERLREVAKTADEAGLAELWLWEDCFFESGIAAAAAALGFTERLRVGIGLLPVPLRNVALTSMEAATLHRIFPDRAIIALGHGVQHWMGQTGSRVESPLTLLREYVDAMRALLRGERVTTNGRYVRLDDVALEWPPGTAPETLVGGTGPKTLKLSGEVADGTVLDARYSPEGVRQALEHVHGGRADRPGHHRVVVFLQTAIGDGARERLHAVQTQRQQDVGVAGDADTVAAAVRAIADAGADTVVLEPLPNEPDLDGFVRFAAEEVQPLL